MTVSVVDRPSTITSSGILFSLERLFRFLMCFHKNALSLFSAIDRAKNSLFFFFFQNVSNLLFISLVFVFVLGPVSGLVIHITLCTSSFDILVMPFRLRFFFFVCFFFFFFFFLPVWFSLVHAYQILTFEVLVRIGWRDSYYCHIFCNTWKE